MVRLRLVFNSASFYLVHKVTTGNRVEPNPGVLLPGPLVNSGVNAVHTNHRKWRIYVSFPVLVTRGEVREVVAAKVSGWGQQMNLLHTKKSDCLV